MEFFDSGQNISIANISMEFLMRNKDNNPSNCYTYGLNGHLQNTETPYHMPAGSFFLHNLSKGNIKSDMPFMMPNNIRKKFENFTKYMSSKENYLMKDTMDHLNQMGTGYPEFLTSQKGYSYVSNSVASYLIGGFVGSKSQMNNEKHKLSYDLGEAVFKILHHYKCDKSFEKVREEKKFEVSKIGRKQKTLFKDSNESFEHDCRMALYNNLINRNGNADPEVKLNKNSYFIQNYNPPTMRNENIKDCSQAILGKVKSDDITLLEKCQMITDTDQFPLLQKISNNNNSSNSNNFINMKIEWDDVKYEDKSKVQCNESGEIEKSKIDPNVENMSSNVICVSPQMRTRQYSECSVESTDSESFIVFDDKCCDSSCEELQSPFLHEYENESDIYFEEDFDCDNAGDDEDSCWIKRTDECDIPLEDKEIAEANIRWSTTYKDVPVDDVDESERKVRFSENVNVHKIIAWDFAYRAARHGPWEQMVRDRDRFKERIHRLSPIISPVLLESHRRLIYDKLYD